MLSTLGTVAALKLEQSLGPLGGVSEAARQMAIYGIFINLILAFFNLIPIPPLDGSHVLMHMLPRRMAIPYRRAGQYGMLVLMGLFFMMPGAFRVLMWPVNFCMGVADAFIRLWI